MRSYNFGGFSLDVTNCELLKNGDHIALTQKSFEILHFLIQNRFRMLKKEELLEVIWTESFVEEANLAQHIYMIRKVLKDNGGEINYIETIPKYGYRFIGEVTEAISDYPNIHTTAPTNNSHVQQNGPNENNNGFSEINGNDDLLKNEIEKNNSPPGTSHKKRSLLIPNILFAIVFAIILATFIYLGFISESSVNSDISSVRSISILPFKYIGSEKDEKLELGLADTLISRLSNQDQITFSPTASIANFTNADSINSIEIGEKLNVDAVLTGTIQKENDFVRVNVQLISVHTKVPLWSDKFDVEFSNIFSLQDKISIQLAKRLSIELKDSPQFAQAPSYAPNALAKEEFIKGLEYWEKRTGENLPKAAKHFENAIAIDSGYAIAYAYLADTYSLASFYKLNKFIPSDIAIDKSRRMANKALELDPNISEAYTALALVAYNQEEFGEATNLYKEAIRLNPQNATAHLRLSWLLTTKDNLDDAINEMRLAQKANPQSQVINSNLARLLRLNRQTDEALNYCRKAVEIDPSNNWARVILAEIYEQKGELDKSIRELKSVPKNAPEEETAKLLLSRVYAKKGEKKEARRILKDASRTKNKTPLPSYEVATIYTHLGEKKEAVKKLQKAKDDSLIYFLHLKYDYNIDALRDSPEYSEILSESKNKVTKTDNKKS